MEKQHETQDDRQAYVRRDGSGGGVEGGCEVSGNELLDLPELNDVPLATAHAISSLALNFALKWHDMTLCKDGVMYQQKKMEGVNFRLIDLPDVLETARQFELHILGSPNRLSEAVLDAVAGMIEEGAGDDAGEDETAELKGGK